MINFSKEPPLRLLGLASFDAFAHLNIAEALNLQPSLILVFALIFSTQLQKATWNPGTDGSPFGLCGLPGVGF